MILCFCHTAAGKTKDEPVCARYKETVHQCSPLMCAERKCHANPKAVCRVNPCGQECTVEFYDHRNNMVDCMEGEKGEREKYMTGCRRRA